jgi:hypothetical protein
MYTRTRPDLIKVVNPPSVREVTGWICRHPDHVVERDTLLDRCPHWPPPPSRCVHSPTCLLVTMRRGIPLRRPARQAGRTVAPRPGVLIHGSGNQADPIATL